MSMLPPPSPGTSKLPGDTVATLDLGPLNALRPPPAPWRRTGILLLVWSAVVIGSAIWHWHRIEQAGADQTLAKARGVAQELLFQQRLKAASGEFAGLAELIEDRRRLHPATEEASARIVTLPAADDSAETGADAVGEAFDSGLGLNTLQNGVPELRSGYSQYGREFLKLVVPITATRECMSCHASRGYEPGQVIAALAVSVPAHSGLAGSSGEYWMLFLIHSGLWSIGLIALLRRGARETRMLQHSDRLEQQLRQVLLDCEDKTTNLSDQLDRTSAELNGEVGMRTRQKERLSLLTQALRQTPVGIIVLDRLGHIEYANPKASEITGYSPEEMLARDITMFKSKEIDPENFDSLMEALRNGRHWQGELLKLRKDRHSVTVCESVFPLGGSESLYSILVFTANDTVDFSEHTLRQLAYIDPVTHLANRREFRRFMREKTADVDKGTEKGFALVYLDLEGFSAVNDAEGPEFGDVLLKTVGQRLHHTVRRKDIVARLDADLFGVILTDVNSSGTVATIISKMRDALHKPVILEGRTLDMRASIGVSMYPRDAEVADKLEKDADVALFRARRLGSQAIQFYAQSVEAVSADRIAVRTALEDALEDEQFDLQYMPMRAIGTQRIDGLEVLLRLDHPALGKLPPDSFLQVAEDTGLIIPIGQWIMRRAISDTNELAATDGEDLPLYFNLSPAQLQRPDLVFDLDQIAIEKNIELTRLGLEFQEEALTPEHQNVIIDNLGQLRERGVKVTLDRFGSGLFSLRYLRDLPLTAVKIDRSFIHASVSDASGERIIAAIISLAKSLDLQTIAVGVETAEQEDLLRQHGCDRLQGKIVSAAVDASVLDALIRSR